MHSLRSSIISVLQACTPKGLPQECRAGLGSGFRVLVLILDLGFCAQVGIAGAYPKSITMALGHEFSQELK